MASYTDDKPVSSLSKVGGARGEEIAVFINLT